MAWDWVLSRSQSGNQWKGLKYRRFHGPYMASGWRLPWCRRVGRGYGGWMALALEWLLACLKYIHKGWRGRRRAGESERLLAIKWDLLENRAGTCFWRCSQPQQLALDTHSLYWMADPLSPCCDTRWFDFKIEQPSVNYALFINGSATLVWILPTSAIARFFSSYSSRCHVSFSFAF